MTIELTQSNLKDLNDKRWTLTDNARIELGEKDFVDAATMDIRHIGITRKTLVRLLNQEVEIDNIKLKLI